jgi:putative integral membrane protein (TIGR02587 family)
MPLELLWDEKSARRFGIGLARASGGAIIFSLPLLMTMEMWELGFYMDRVRLALLLALAVPLLTALSFFSGFEETTSLTQDAIDAFVALAVGFISTAIVLLITGILTPDMPVREIVSKVSLQAVPAAIGAMLAESQFGSNGERPEARNAGYGGELFFMAAGALFLAFNVACTEEIMLIAFKMTHWHAIGLMMLSIVTMHSFVYAVEFQGQHTLEGDQRFWSVFLRYTIAGYAIVLAISLYVLWTFGRTDGMSIQHMLMMAIVLGFPSAIGAAAARLIL